MAVCSIQLLYGGVMATINVYEQYFGASVCFYGVERRGVRVALIAESGGGEIRYVLAISFFPHRTDDDFAIAYDAYFEKTLYQAKGRRSKKREAAFLEQLRSEADILAAEQSASIDWMLPLIEPRYG